MRIYNVSASGTIVDAENILLQLRVPPTTRARISSWDVSFNGIIAGNSLEIKLTSDSTSGSFTEAVAPSVLDGSYNQVMPDNQFLALFGFVANPTTGSVISGPFYLKDTAFLLHQYASGAEPVLDQNTPYSLRCTPNNLVAAVDYKVNVILVA